MPPKKTSTRYASSTPPKKTVEVELYPDLPKSVGDKLRERYGDRVKRAKPISQVSW